MIPVNFKLRLSNKRAARVFKMKPKRFAAFFRGRQTAAMLSKKSR